MPFPCKIQPVDFNSPFESAFSKTVLKSRLKRLLDRPFGNVLRITGPEKSVTDGGNAKDDSDEFEPSSVCLANMVKCFIEDGGDEESKCSEIKCYCLNNSDSDDELDSRDAYACQVLKNLVMCSNALERNLLADTAKIIKENKLCKSKNDYIRKSVTVGLIALGYDASICKSRWRRADTYPAGEYEYLDVLKDGERLIVDIDFRSEFEIARSTKMYNAILEIVPKIFVGKADRIQKIVYIVSDATKRSLRNKGMSFPPWRRADYVRSKWLAPHTRIEPPAPPRQSVTPTLPILDSANDTENLKIGTSKMATSPGIAGVMSPASDEDHSDDVFNFSEEDESK